MSLSDLFTFRGASVTDSELPDIYPMSMNQSEFTDVDTFNLYFKILTDAIERTHGLPDDVQKYLWDNCLASESSEGLISMLARAMTDKSELFLVFDRALGVIRRATSNEATQIKSDYSASGQSGLGVYISFKKYAKTDLIRFYSALEFLTVTSLNKSMNISKAIQLKMSDMRAGTSLTDSQAVIDQAKTVATCLKQGKDILLDAKDVVETSRPDLTSVEKAMGFINEKKSFYSGMPASYITGIQPKGLGDSGQGDAKAVDRGLKGYYFSIIKPVTEAVFGSQTTFKNQDYSEIGTGLEALKTFELVSDAMMTSDDKKMIISKLFNLSANVNSL
jgi:hypothetical protein